MSTADLDARRQRAGHNQSLFREVNERIEQLAAPSVSELDRSRRVDFVCECAAEECAEQISVLLDEYEAVRGVSSHFVVKIGREIAEVERVVSERDGFVVVEKIGVGEHIAERLDPRRRPSS